MNKATLIAQIAEKSGLERKQAEKALDAFVDTVTSALKAGDKVQLVGFGSFEVKERAAHSGRNPATGEAIEIPASKTPSFKAGKTLRELGVTEDPVPDYVSAKEVVLPFIKFPGVDILLGPEMRSTGEVMGIDRNMGLAFAKSQIAAGNRVPTEGAVFISLNNRDKAHAEELGRGLIALGFKLYATKGTAEVLRNHGLEVNTVFKVGEGRPNVVDLIINGDVNWIINTPLGSDAKADEKAIRRTVIERGLPIMTTVAAARAGIQCIRATRDDTMHVLSLQEYHAELAKKG